MLFCMKWSAVNFDWNRARAFLATAEEGSLSAAARALGVAQPTLGRQVAALEKQLGVALFDRIGRKLILTPGGLELADHVRAMRDAANRVSLSAAGQSQSVEGSIAIAASEIAAAYLLPPIIKELRREFPGVHVKIIASNATSDLMRREADIAIRAYRPEQPDLIAKRLQDVAVRLYATPDYLDGIGNPATADALSRADFIGFDDTGRFSDFLNGYGLDLTNAHFGVLTLNQLVQWELVKNGAGIGVMLEQVGDAEHSVVRVLPSLRPMMFPTWLTAHSDLNTNRRVRIVFDRLAAELSAA